MTIKEVIEAYDDSPNTLRNIVNLESRNPVKHPFYSIFMAFFELLVWEDKSPVDAKQIMHSLRGLQSGMTSTAKYTKTGDRKRNIKITKGLIEDYFVHEEPSLLKHGPGLAIDFENSLMRSRTETPRYEFKQGLLDLYEDRKLNKDLIDRIINTACGMANLGPDYDGYIYIGVADKKSDADRIKQLYGRDYIEVKGHYVVGIDREMKYLNLKDEAYIRKITEQINTSKLSEPLKSQILAHIDTVTYRGYVIVRLLVPSQKGISFVGEMAYLRQNSDTKEAKAPQISGIIENFKTRNV